MGDSLAYRAVGVAAKVVGIKAENRLLPCYVGDRCLRFAHFPSPGVSVRAGGSGAHACRSPPIAASRPESQNWDVLIGSSTPKHQTSPQMFQLPAHIVHKGPCLRANEMVSTVNGPELPPPISLPCRSHVESSDVVARLGRQVGRAKRDAGRNVSHSACTPARHPPMPPPQHSHSQQLRQRTMHAQGSRKVALQNPQAIAGQFLHLEPTSPAGAGTCTFTPPDSSDCAQVGGQGRSSEEQRDSPPTI